MHPDNYHLLGIKWKGSMYVDRALPFGLRLAPNIFNATVLSWVLNCQGIQCQLHYLDDILFIGAPDSQQMREDRSRALQTLTQLGVPVAAHKTQGLSTALTFLGILVDTSTFQLHLLGDKLTRLQNATQQWARKRACT